MQGQGKWQTLVSKPIPSEKPRKPQPSSAQPEQKAESRAPASNYHLLGTVAAAEQSPRQLSLLVAAVWFQAPSWNLQAPTLARFSPGTQSPANSYYHGQVSKRPRATCQPQGHWFDSQSRAHAWDAGQVCSRGHLRRNHTMFLSLYSSLPSPPKNKIIFKNLGQRRTLL